MLDKVLLGKKLRRLREISGTPREDLAEMLHIDLSTYGRYETGHNMPPTEHLRSLAEFHNVSVDSLLSPDPIVFTIHHANGTQVANGTNAKFVQHVVSEEFVREVFQRFDKHMEQQEAMNTRLVAMLDRMTSTGRKA
ncbi:MAG: helix-turn-helix transcriptional regulator [Flavobacteriales bacterium]|nr:helix-turn-helix transcriptional regulator [Flavobacteriales bacterium]